MLPLVWPCLPPVEFTVDLCSKWIYFYVKYNKTPIVNYVLSSLPNRNLTHPARLILNVAASTISSKKMFLLTLEFFKNFGFYPSEDAFPALRVLLLSLCLNLYQIGSPLKAGISFIFTFPVGWAQGIGLRSSIKMCWVGMNRDPSWLPGPQPNFWVRNTKGPCSPHCAHPQTYTKHLETWGHLAAWQILSLLGRLPFWRGSSDSWPAAG